SNLDIVVYISVATLCKRDLPAERPSTQRCREPTRHNTQRCMAMKNWKATLTGLVVATNLVAAPAVAETLRVGMECTYAPFNYRTSDGELAGYDVDVAKGIAEIIGADLEFVCQEWDGMIPALLANKFDL